MPQASRRQGDPANRQSAAGGAPCRPLEERLSGVLAGAVFGVVALDPVQDLGVSNVDTGPADDLDPLAFLEILVVLEEMLNLPQADIRYIPNRFPVLEQRTDVIGGGGQEVGIAPGFIVPAEESH